MASKGKRPSKKMGLVGCGTPEVMFRASARKFFSAIDGVVGIEVRKDKIIVRVRDEQVKSKLPKQFRRRPVEAIVVGTITARSTKRRS